MIKPDLGIRIFDANLANQPNFFKGAPNLQLLEMDPLVTGYAFIVWTKVPSWILSLYPGFKNLTQKNFKEFSGLTDMELQTSAYNYGFAGNEYHVATNLQKQNVDFTIKHQEFSGSPIKNMYQAWVTGIRDPETGISTYPAMFGIDYAAKNHTGELMYIVTRPDANNVGKKNIEFAAYYTNVMPTKLPLQHFQFTQGQHDSVELDITFKGNLHLSAQVDAFAQQMLKTTYAFRSEGMFDPLNANYGGTFLPDFPADHGSTGSGGGDLPQR